MTFLDTSTNEIYPNPEDSGARLSLANWLLDATAVWVWDIANDILSPDVGQDLATKRVWLQIKDWMFDQGLYSTDKLREQLRGLAANLEKQSPWEDAIADIAASFNFTADGAWWFVRYLVRYVEEVRNRPLYDLMESYRGADHVRERWSDVIMIHPEKAPDDSIFYRRISVGPRSTGNDNIKIA